MSQDTLPDDTTMSAAELLRDTTAAQHAASDPLASAWYRREVAPVHLRRLLLGEDR